MCYHAQLFKNVGARDPNSAFQAFCQLSSLASLPIVSAAVVAAAFFCFYFFREGIGNYYGLEQYCLLSSVLDAESAVC